jgi:hypothetical protein
MKKLHSNGNAEVGRRFPDTVIDVNRSLAGGTNVNEDAVSLPGKPSARRSREGEYSRSTTKVPVYESGWKVIASFFCCLSSGGMRRS